MSSTVVGVNSPLARKLWSADLFVDITKSAYWTRKFMSTGDTLPIQLKTELESDSGDEIRFDLSVAISGEPVRSDNKRAGSESPLTFYQDTVKIDQLYKGVSAGGKMSRKRTLHELRKIAKARLKEYWSRLFDELIFIYLSGARGVNSDFVWDSDFAGTANNSVQAPDADHILYGDGSSKGTLTTGGKMSRAVIERAITKAITLGGGSAGNGLVKLQPCQIEGGAHYCVVMHTYQEHDLRTNTTTGDWLDIQKAAAGAEGRNNPIFQGSMGMIRNAILHSHESVIRFDDYGAGSPGTVDAARALLLGRQGGVMAFGSPGDGLRFSWIEEMEDRGNELIVGSDTIVGVKKSRFNSKDFGVLAIDTAAADPA